ncbi:MAG: hypothetical protein IJU50_00800 [Lachnospiraceae bacterium]|nr:hypothetical protein [Lachnospiraceae bacterium]
MASRMEDILDELEEYVESCKLQPFSSTKIVVVKDDLDQYIHELRARIPEEIKQCQKIVQNQEAILKDAQDKRDAIVNDAKKKAEELITKTGIETDKLVSENEIMKQAYAQAEVVIGQAAQSAQSTLDNATIESNNMINAAVQYTDQSLAFVENILLGSLEAAQNDYAKLTQDIRHYLDIIHGNRNELSAQQQNAQVPAEAGPELSAQSNAPQ